MENSLETAAILLNETLAIRENLIQTVAMLLEETSVMRKRCEDRYKETGRMYNIFKTAGICEDEVIMCRVLADLLAPKGFHYRGDLYLKLFIDMVVIPRVKEATAFNLSKAMVKAEHPTDKGKRIDIVIKDGNVFIPIEAKINAGEREQQLSDYAAFSKKMNRAVGFIPVLFLTRDGRDSDEAIKDKYIPISFERDIVFWLDACLELEETKKAPPVREIIKQFINAIKSFCGNMEDETMEKEIKDLIMKSDDSYEAALQISKVVNEVSGKVWGIFENKILNLVKKEFPDMECYPESKSLWYGIHLGNGIVFSVSHDMEQYYVQKAKLNEPLSAERKDKIITTMSGKINDGNTAKDTNIWVSGNAHYPGLEDYDGDMYIYKLYQIYSEKPQSAADWIVSIAKELEKI